MITSFNYEVRSKSGVAMYSAMRFNHRELALYAASRLGKGDKESCLWMKECEGILRKKESELSKIMT